MSYEKQTWNKYDELKTEEENIENGAVVTDNRMNHMESGIGDNDNNLVSHLADTNNPHKVTAAQVGLGNVQNFGLATEDESKQGISNAKYMTPSLTQAVLSANINSIAYANSADGTDRFTTVYPNLNLIDGTKDFSGTWTNSDNWVTDGTYKGLTVKKRTGQWNGIYKTFTAPKDGTYTFSAYVKSSGNSAYVIRFGGINTSDSQGALQKDLGNNFDWIRDTVTVNLKANDTAWIKYEISGTGADSIVWNAGHKWEQGSTSTPYMQSASEVTTYVGFSNTIKTNKSASDYTWFPVKDSELTNKVDSHINNKANPHSITASQVGTYTKQEIDTKLSKTVMTDDYGKVTVNDLVASSITLPNDTDGWQTLLSAGKGNFKCINGTVTIQWDVTQGGTAGNFAIGDLPTQYVPSASIMTAATAFSVSAVNDTHMQINGGSGGGGITILSAKANQRYAGQYKFDI